MPYVKNVAWKPGAEILIDDVTPVFAWTDYGVRAKAPVVVDPSTFADGEETYGGGIIVPKGTAAKKHEYSYAAPTQKLMESYMYGHSFVNGWGLVGSTCVGDASEHVALRATMALPKAAATEYITAWRGWRVLLVGSKTVLLQSANHETLWPPGEALSALSAPSQRGQAGIYGFRVDTTDLRVQKEARKHDYPNCTVWGTVALWGTCIEHARGYRAQYAYPLSLWAWDEPLAARLARAYGCEIAATPYPAQPGAHESA